MSEFLLTFWQTAVVVACRHQAAIIEMGSGVNWDEKKIQDWFDSLLKRFENGTISAEDAFLLQHDQLIFEQFGMPTTADSNTRCSLKNLLKSLFVASAQESLDVCPLAQRVYLHYLIASSHASDLYLNAALAISLRRYIFDSEDVTICYNNNDNDMYVLVDVHMIRGRIVNAGYCSVMCALHCLQQVNAGVSNATIETAHVADCKNRTATWLLLTFGSVTNPKEIRQMHCDVAAIGYAVKHFIGNIPVPFHHGFFPVISDDIYGRFAKTSLMNVLAKSDKYKWNPQPKETYYLIDTVECVYDVENHKTGLQSFLNTTLEAQVKPLRMGGLISLKLEKSLHTRGKEATTIMLISLLKKHNISRHEAAEMLATMQAIVHTFVEAHNANFFFENLKVYDLITLRLQTK